VEHVERMGEIINACRTWVGSLRERTLGVLGAD